MLTLVLHTSLFSMTCRLLLLAWLTTTSVTSTCSRSSQHQNKTIIEGETDRREGKGRRCCLDVYDVH